MEIRVLKYFLAVAQEENITRAAERLHVSQPTISRQLRQLEEELGVSLFERGSHTIQLTAQGMLLRQRAQEIVALAEHTQRELAQDSEALSGEIAIGSGELRSVDALADALADFRREHPLVRYSLISGNVDQIRQGLENGCLDLGLLSMPAEVERYGFLRLNGGEEWGLLVREDAPLTRKGMAEPQDLDGKPVLLSSRESVQRELSNWLGDCTPENVMTYNLMYNAAAMVRKGLGMAICIRLDCEYKELKFLPFSPKLTTGAALVWKRERLQTPVVRALIDYLKEKQQNGSF